MWFLPRNSAAKQGANVPHNNGERWSGLERWIDIRGTLLLCAIILYFSLLFAAAFGIINLMLRFWTPGPESWKWPLFALCSAILVQIAWRLWRELPGLVTTVYDTAAEETPGIPLEREQYAELYSAVADVGARIDSPLPDKVWLTHTAACFVTEERKFALTPQRKLNLVLGMPQFGTLTVNELKVILAHELAHFLLGETRLRVFCFRFVESLKIALQEMRNYPAWWINPVYWFCAAFVRLFIALTAPVERQQELRADAISAQAFGGDVAMHTLLKNWQLVRQFEELLEDQRNGDSTRNAADRPGDANIYRWFAQHWRELSAQGYQILISRLVQEERASPWDSHPTTQERIKVMRAFPDREQPELQAAHQLLHNLTELEDRLDSEVRALSGRPPASAS